jgi:tetratricopeptide (TPR) repeat protein
MQRSSKQPEGGGGELRDVSSSGDVSKSSARINGRRKWLFRITAILLAPAFFFALELVLRLAGYGYDPHFFKKLDIEGKPFLVQNEDFSRRFFPPETMRQPNALRMRAEKPAGAIRIFVLGESAAMGDPEPGFGPSRFLEVLLQQRFPEREFEIVNVAFTAINSHVLLPLASECAKHDGDLWIIYMGNNEMVGPYGAATILGAQAPPRQFVRLVTAIQRTRVGQLGMAMTRRLQKPSTQSASWGGMAMFQNQRVAPKSPKREAVYANFAGNLQGMLKCALDSGAGVILNTVAVNLHDSPPFASLPNKLLTPADRARFDELFQSAVKAQISGDWPRAVGLFGQALQIDEGFAEAHYRRAFCLERIGQLQEARKHYQMACDTDALPFRTDSRINASIREAAGRHAGDRVLLVDAPVALAKETASDLCGQETFYEHVHFNFDGGYRLGRAWAQAVGQMLPKESPGQTTNDWVSQSLCERRLGLTDWNRKLVAQSVMQRFKSPPLNVQFNNPDRLQRLSDYERSLLLNANKETVAKAREIFAEAIAARPDDHHIYEAFAVFLQSLGDLPGAIRVWHKVGELLPHDFLPWFEIGSLLAKQGSHSEGQAYLRKALALRPGLIEGWSELGQSLGASGQFPPALEAFQRACQLRPTDPVLWAFRAKVLGSLERRTEAIDCYRKAVELNPSYAEAHAALGDQYSMAGKTTEAISEYEAAIRAKPDYAIAHLNLGLMFVRQGRWDEAVTEFRQTLALEPGNPVAQDYLKQVQARRNQSQ